MLGTYHPKSGLEFEKHIPDDFDEAIEKLLPRDKAVSILDECYKEMTRFGVDWLGDTASPERDASKKPVVSRLLEFGRPRFK